MTFASFGLNLDLFSALFFNVLVMLSLTTMILGLQKTGGLVYLTKPFDRFKTSRSQAIAWFVLSVVFSGLTTNLILANILIPMAVVYAKERTMDPVELNLAVLLGILAGTEFFPYGGGDTIIENTLISHDLHRPLGLLTWGQMMWVPTILACLITGLWLAYKVVNNKTLTEFKTEVRGSAAMLMEFMLLIAGVYLTFRTKLQGYVVLVAFLSALVSRLPAAKLKTLPFKAIIYWSLSLILGKILSVLLKTHVHFTIPSNVYSFGGIFLFIAVVFMISNFLTRSALSSMIMPLVLASAVPDKLWLSALAIKSFSLGYLLIFSDSANVVSVGYGLRQSKLLRIGLPIALMQMAAYILYFYFTKTVLTP
ncbi:hypothetical protein DEAC_c23700 [Desulfosporosinus acididurans]|uniref:Uncharacterized protein n=1 Tax=Desulfosporosinus acididurans TaxID=476652 RepID=A0A0J1FQF5_9FIRM|nr:hypothetical protein [Desulfosporosinus acididurans]KLU65740.1 hypothetical protein DEAC_c23700 [Desulfosporosinus acididurans]